MAIIKMVMGTEQPKIGDTLFHRNSGVLFKYLGDYRPQFSTQTFVELLNFKSNKVERFQKGTYLQFFKIIK